MLKTFQLLTVYVCVSTENILNYWITVRYAQLLELGDAQLSPCKAIPSEITALL